MEYKKTYSQEEITDIISWAKENMEHFPESLQLDAATFIPNLRATMETYIEICEQHYDNPTYGAQIRHIFLMREKLIEDNLLKSE